MIALAYNNGGFCLDFGYNLFWKDDEETKLKGGQFTDGVWGIAQRTFDTSAALLGGAAGSLPVTAAADLLSGRTLKATDLSVKAAETPSQVTHKIFAALGYVFKDWECPLMLGLGGGYEFRGSNAALEKWELWLKLGVGF